MMKKNPSPTADGRSTYRAGIRSAKASTATFLVPLMVTTPTHQPQFYWKGLTKRGSTAGQRLSTQSTSHTLAAQRGIH
ncbi:unnamed protein product [Clavelina lepadiformis]|uniref:Uncharacterized protein n=1 Tax=Clavelina lepadiformis TaxID=159417 RepID=A0ABP0F037_CLALP